MRRALETIESIAAMLLLGVALLTALNVVLRDTLAVQIPDWFDGARLMLCVALFWGIAVATWRGGHICVDVVWEHLGTAGRRRLDVLATALSLVMLAPLAWMVWVKVATMGAQATSDLRMPLAWFFAVAAVGTTAAALLCAARLVTLARRP